MDQLSKAIKIKEQIESLEGQLNSLFGARSRAPKPAKSGRRAGMSAATRAKIAAAARARWAKAKGKKSSAKRPAAKVKRARRKMSASARAKLAALAKARWAKIKSAGKNRL